MAAEHQATGNDHGARRAPTLVGNRPAGGDPSATNRVVLLRELRLGAPISRIDLSKRTGISKPAVTRGVAALIDDGLVVEARLGDAGTHGGRRPRMLELVPSAAAGLGCMVKAGRLVGCLGGFNGEIEHRETVDFDPLSDPEDVIATLVELMSSLMSRNSASRPVLAMGMSVPGLVDDIGRVLAMPHMPGWRGLELSTVLEEKMGMPVYLDNESRVQAIAEAWFGQARGARSFVCLETGAAISAGIVVNGELWRGTHSLAGEIGHFHMTGGGARCYCDSRGCWEMTASTTQLLSNVKTSSIARSDQMLYQDTELTMERLVAAADAGDEIALREIEAHAEALAEGICNLIVAYDPERIILHGDSILLGERLAGMLRARVAARFRLWLDYRAPIELTRLGTEGALAGAVNLALHGAWGFGDPTAELGGPVAV
jgi:predicted NBD/HSP70 family sugar kinase/DNA-binding transcriptional ArsR family regulator